MPCLGLPDVFLEASAHTKARVMMYRIQWRQEYLNAPEPHSVTCFCPLKLALVGLLVV